MGRRILPALLFLTAASAVAPASVPDDGPAASDDDPDASAAESADGGVAAPGPAAPAPEPAPAPASAAPDDDAGPSASDGPTVAAAEGDAAAAQPPRRASAVPRRRDAAAIGGWVRSAREGGAIAVEEIVLGSNGEWRRREAIVSPESGLAAPPTQSVGTWFTQEGSLVLLEQDSLAAEAMRAPYLVDDRGDTLTLTTGEGTGPAVFYRFR